MESLSRRPQTARQAPVLRQNAVRKACCPRGRAVPRARPVTPVTCLSSNQSSPPGNKATFFARQCATLAIGAASQIAQPLWCSALVAAAPDCPGQTEPVVHFLLAALVVGASVRVKELLTGGVSVGSVKDEKALVGKARARHRAFLKRERALLTAEEGVLKPAFPTQLLQLGNLGPGLLSFSQAKPSSPSRGLAATAGASPASAGLTVQSREPRRALPLPQGKRLPVPMTPITTPVVKSVLRARGASLLMPLQALSSATVRAFRKSVGLPIEEASPLSAAPPAEIPSGDALAAPQLPTASPFASVSGAVGGKFAVGASTVVEDVGADVADAVESNAVESTPSVRFPALEELFLRSPDEPMERPRLPDPPQRGAENPGMASPGARRRRDPADFVGPNLTASRARAMLRLDTDRAPPRAPAPPPSPMPMPVASPSPVSRITRVTEPSFRPRVLRKTLEPADHMPATVRRAVPADHMPATVRRAVPAPSMPRMSTTRPSPREMAKARTMGSLRNENGARIRGASSVPVSAGLALDLAAVEEARTRSAAYEAKVAELWRAADRRRQEEVKKMRQREWQLMDALPRRSAQAVPWTVDASNSVRQAIGNIRKPGIWAFLSSLWTGFWSNLTHRVDSHFRRPRDMFAGIL